MRLLTSKLICIFIIFLSIFSCNKDNEEVYVTENYEIPEVDYTPFEIDVIDLLNDHRTKLGITPLKILNIVSGVADGHTTYMISVGQVSHDNFSERTQLLMDILSAKSVGENVAYGYRSTQGVVDGWLGSENHRKIIENPNYTHFGISIDTCSGGNYYFTNIFIKQ